MNFIDNRRWLSSRYRAVAELVAQNADMDHEEEFEIETAKSGDPTLKLKVDGKEKYIYSKYNPRRGSARLFKEFKSGTPVLFIGVGLGYQIEEFIQQNPHAKYAIFEPNPTMLVEYVRNTNFKKYNANNMLNFWAGSDDLASQLEILLTKARKKIQIIIFPGYEELYNKEVDAIQKRVLTVMKEEKDSLSVDISFQQRWILNSIKNFPSLMESHNITLSKNKDYFIDKTAYIVSAGPSLDLEYDNLRKIKKNGLGFIFSVGSAINSLLDQDIKPHATFTYDPKARNARVIQKIKDSNITDIPLIYGSSVGYETIIDYPGPRYHFITSQDYISSLCLQADENIPIINDAPSIAVISLQVLINMGFKKIVFIGQNLGYTNEHRHASGVNYKTFYNPKLTEQEKENLLKVRSVAGGLINTDEMMLSMKAQLEMYIDRYDDVNYINTTKNGAQINGTLYQPLSNFLQEVENLKEIQKNNLFNSFFEYDMSYVNSQLEKVGKDMVELELQLKDAMNKLQSIDKLVKTKQKSIIELHLGQFDKYFSSIENNLFYNLIVKKVIRVEYKNLVDLVADVRNVSDVLYKGNVIIVSFNNFLNLIYKYYLWGRPLFVEMSEKIKESRGSK